MNDNGKWEDKGIRQALKSEKPVRLASNFTYRMLQRLEQERLRKEKQRERQLFVLMVCTTLLMATGCLGGLYWWYSEPILAFIHRLAGQLTFSREWGFYLPMLGTLPILAGFNWWLRKRFRHLLE